MFLSSELRRLRMTPTELSRYQETAWNNWIRRKLTSSELALCETRTDCSRRGQTHFKSVNDSEADVLSLRRYGRANHRGGAERVRHRAADSVRGKAPLLAVRLGEDCYAISAKGDRQQDHVLVVDPPARRVAGRADDRDRALGAFDGERLQTLSGRGRRRWPATRATRPRRPLTRQVREVASCVPPSMRWP